MLGACGAGTSADGRADGNPAKVSIRAFQFMPGRLDVKTGDSVTWTNNDDIRHTVTAGAPGAPSGLFDETLNEVGATQTHTFMRTGTEPYFCDIHQSMRGEIVVS